MSKLTTPVTALHIKPGEFFFGSSGEQLRTLLGSCVAITLWHPRRHLGGMSHCLLPQGPAEVATLDGRYCDHAVALFMQALRHHGVKPCEFEVKLFGGGNMFPSHGLKEAVGHRNIEKTRQLLKSHGFSIKAQHVGQNGHRTVILSLQNGDTWLRWRPINA